jgi:hypothetical protein
MIYAFKKRKSFSEDAKIIRPLLNDTVDHHRNLAGTEIRQPHVNVAGFRPSSLDFGHQTDHIPATWPESGENGRISAGWPDQARTTGRLDSSGSSSFRPVCRSPAVLSRIPANPYSNKTIQIPAFILDYSYSSHNPVKVTGILSVSDEISSPVIFILFYINIYMF